MVEVAVMARRGRRARRRRWQGGTGKRALTRWLRPYLAALISLLLRLVRGPSPIVPRIGDGDQPIQPIWGEDCAEALATVVEGIDLAGRELDMAGPEVPAQNDLIARFGRQRRASQIERKCQRSTNTGSSRDRPHSACAPAAIGFWPTSKGLRGSWEHAYASNRPAGAALRELAKAVGRLGPAQAHQQLMEKVGLGHFQGRRTGWASTPTRRDAADLLAACSVDRADFPPTGTLHSISGRNVESSTHSVASSELGRDYSRRTPTV